MKSRTKAKKAASSPKARSRHTQRAHSEADISPWTEALFAAELLILHATPIYYGFGVPRGDDSAVIIIPGFLGTDLYLMELHAWLGRIGYRPYFSGIGINADCPNLLIQRHVIETVQRALSETGRPIHLIGHSLGGVIARSIAGQRPRDVASVITLASPIRGTIANRNVVHAADAIRLRILQEHGKGFFLTATPDAAPVILLTPCAVKFPSPCSRPRSTPAMMALSIGATAGPQILKATLKCRALTLEWHLILRPTPLSPSGWQKRSVPNDSSPPSLILRRCLFPMSRPPRRADPAAPSRLPGCCSRPRSSPYS